MHKRQTTFAPVSIQPAQLQLLAVPEVARLLAVGKTTVYKLINTKELPVTKIGSATRITLHAVNEYIQQQSEQTPPEEANLTKYEPSTGRNDVKTKRPRRKPQKASV